MNRGHEDCVSIDLYEEKLVELASALAAARWLLTSLRFSAEPFGFTRKEIEKSVAAAEARWPGVFGDMPPISPCPNPKCRSGFVPAKLFHGWSRDRCPDCAAKSAGQAAFLPKGGE